MDIGDRMKFYENLTTKAIAMPRIPLCARMDGRAFHTFTAGLERPFDPRFSTLMVATARYLTIETNARIGYTQSDEISLVWHEPDPDTMFPFDGKIFKLVSILASMATAYFNQHLPQFLPDRVGRMPLFDTRVWSVPSLDEAANYLLWREQDATRNSINMAAQSVYSHKELNGMNTKQAQEMLFAAGINWNEYPRGFKRGTYFQRQTIERPFTTEELDRLPPKHEARTNPGLVVRRQDVVEMDWPPLGRIGNRVAVLFSAANPEKKDESVREEAIDD